MKRVKEVKSNDSRGTSDLLDWIFGCGFHVLCNTAWQTGTQAIVVDSDALHEAIRIGECGVYIDRKKLDNILAEQNVEEDVFFLYFGGYSKIPGVGGGGDCMVVLCNLIVVSCVCGY